MEISILKQGDKVISVTDKTLAIKHANGEVSIYHYLIDSQERKIQMQSILSICFEDGERECDVTADGAFEIVHF